MKVLLTILFLVNTRIVSYGAEQSSADNIEYFTKDNNLVVVDKIHNRKIKVNNLNSIKSLEIIIHKTKEIKDDNKDNQKLSKHKIEDAEISKYILKAKKLFSKGKIVEAWDIVDELETRVPNDYRIKTMKGSLYFTSGDYKKAILYWNKSLKINKNQTQVKDMIKEAQRKTKK